MWQDTNEAKALVKSKPKICFVCASGERSQTTATIFNNDFQFKNSYYLLGGKKEWVAECVPNAFVFNDDWITVNSYFTDDPEKCGLAIQLTLAAANKGKTVTLVLMHSAVWIATQTVFMMDVNDDSPRNLDVGVPFKPWREMIGKLVKQFQCQILCCTSCLRRRKIPTSDLMDFAIAIKGPDLVEMFDKGGHVLQFM